MRRSIVVAVGAAVAAGALVPVASAAGADRPDSMRAAKSAAASPANTWVREALRSGHDRDWFRFSMRHSGRALVTLGHLPADYSLRIYNSRGNALGGSDHAGTRFEQVYRHFAAGDYFVRVAPSAGTGSSTRYALQFRPLRPAMVVAEQRNVGDVDGFDIKGELLNNTSAWRNVLRVHVTWLDRNGNKVGTHDEGVIPGPVGPHRRVEFNVVARRGSKDLPSTATSYRLKVDSQKTSDRTPGGLRMVPGKQATTKTQRLYDGTLTNRSSQTLRGIYPTVIEYDTYGRALAFGFDYIAHLAPGETKNYEAVINIKDLPKPNGIRSFASITK